MTRKTALQLLLCGVGYPALKAQEQDKFISTLSGNTLSSITFATVLTISFDHVKEIHLMKDGKKRVVKMDEIWDAIEPKKE